MPRPSALSFAALCAVAGALLAGCDADADSLLGEFRGSDRVGAEVRGDLEGEAVYTVAETAAGPVFVLGLFVGDLFESDVDEYDYVLFRRLGDRPGVGAYAVEADPVTAFSATLARADDVDESLEADDESDDDDRFRLSAALAGTDGTLAISRVDDYGNVLGTYDLEAEGVLLPRGGRVTGAARGRFEARYEPPSTFRRLGLDLGI